MMDLSLSMTSTVVSLFHSVARALFTPEPKISPRTVSHNAMAILGGLGIHAAYVYSTEKQEKIYVMDVYQRVHHGSTVFAVVDGEGRHFTVNNSLWFWKWDSIEDWHRIQRGYPLTVRYYGWRIPAVGLFPTIVRSIHETSTKM